MGKRLSKIATRTGDDGTTGLGDGTRIAKDHPRIEAIGCIDELNSALGTVLACDIPPVIKKTFNTLQHQLFDLGGELSIPGHTVMSDKAVNFVEEILNNFNKDLPGLKDFILPSGGLATSHCHMARTICRRAERRCWSLNKTEELNPHSLTYLNRLSDLLFITCRLLARHENGSEVLWQPEQ